MGAITPQILSNARNLMIAGPDALSRDNSNKRAARARGCRRRNAGR
jgi:hypothetical protein